MGRKRVLSLYIFSGTAFLVQPPSLFLLGAFSNKTLARLLFITIVKILYLPRTITDFRLVDFPATYLKVQARSGLQQFKRDKIAKDPLLKQGFKVNIYASLNL